MSKYTAGIQKLKTQKVDLERKINKLDRDIQKERQKSIKNDKYTKIGKGIIIIIIVVVVILTILRSN